MTDKTTIDLLPWKNIRCLLLDSDGVLTDGGVYQSGTDAPEYRRFDIKDGYGIVQLIKRGIQVAIISKSPSTPVRKRCEKLGMSEIHLGVAHKLSCADEIRQRYGLKWQEIAFMGDDIPDLELLQKVGISLAPLDAVKTIRESVHWVSQYPGGKGAVREVADLLLDVEVQVSG